MSEPIRCLSVRQPWAGLIAEGKKTIELRSWKTKYRGAVIICASKGADDFALPFYPGHAEDRGNALCIVELVDVRPATKRDTERACWEPEEGVYAWILMGARPLTSTVPVHGRLSLFQPPRKLLEYLPRGC